VKLVKKKISDFKIADYNPRSISENELKKLKNSIKKFGYVEPIIINEITGNIIGGHQRFKALKELGYKEVDCISIKVNEAEERALNLALNKIQGEWDNQKLISVLKEIQELEEEQLINTGFSDEEIMYLLELERREKERIQAVEDEYAISNEVKTNLRIGDVIQLGENHKLIIGDSTDPDVWRELLGEERIDLVMTSPPYNLNINYGKYSDNKELKEYLEMIKKVFQNAINYMNKGRYACINIGREWGPINMPAKYDLILEEIGYVFFRNIYWSKPLGSARVGSIKNPFPRHYKPKVQTEIIQVYAKEPINDADVMIQYVYGVENKKNKKPKKEIIPQILLSKYAGNVWNIHTETTLSKHHPAPYPLQLPFNCIRFYTFKDEIVVDPFVGSGTTILAAEQLGRKTRCIELDPEYAQVIINRYKNMFPNQKIKCINRKVIL